MRSVLLMGAALALFAGSALADPISVHDGQFTAAVAAKDVSRLSILGERIATVRISNDPGTPKINVDPDQTTGDVFVSFEGDPGPQAVYTLFLITQSGKTVEALLHPVPEHGLSVIVSLGAGYAAAAPVPDGRGAQEPSDPLTAPSAPPVAARGDRREGYPELLTALVRLMFNDAEAPGVSRVEIKEQTVRRGAFLCQRIRTYQVGDLKGTVLSVHNESAVGQPLSAKAFLAPGVLSAAVSHETVAPGQYARIYFIEAANQ